LQTAFVKLWERAAEKMPQALLSAPFYNAARPNRSARECPAFDRFPFPLTQKRPCFFAFGAARLFSRFAIKKAQKIRSGLPRTDFH
jgi:hypothetical protein